MFNLVIDRSITLLLHTLAATVSYGSYFVYRSWFEETGNLLLSLLFHVAVLSGSIWMARGLVLSLAPPDKEDDDVR